MHFASDNTSPVAPEVMEALTRANEGYVGSYGADPLMAAVTEKVREVFEAPDAEVRLVATGTAANSLALATLVQPWQTVFCHRHAHIEDDECAAPEFFSGGAKLTLLDGEHGRIDPEALAAALARVGGASIHNVQKGALSLTNATESGAAYRPENVARLCGLAHEAGIPVHMDGSRLANALAFTGATPAAMTWRAGVDVLSLGGTKNGLMGVEAVVLFDPSRAQEFEHRRKRGGHLFSKHRYLSAQMLAYLTDGLWLRLAGQANAAAKRLAEGIATLPGAALHHPVEANEVFAAFPRGAHRRALAAGAAYYLWPDGQSLDGDEGEPVSARLVASWSTTTADVDAFLGLLRG